MSRDSAERRQLAIVEGRYPFINSLTMLNEAAAKVKTRQKTKRKPLRPVDHGFNHPSLAMEPGGKPFRHDGAAGKFGGPRPNIDLSTFH